MNIFKPTVMKKNLLDITPDTFKDMGVTHILLDVDNTLVSYISHEPISGAVPWVKEMEAKGLKLIIVSNNFKKRVGLIAEKFDLPFITFACKPLPFGYLEAKGYLKASTSECAIVGDQIFTDIVGANLCGMKSILLDPVEMENSKLFRVRRNFEKKYRNKFKDVNL